MTDSDPATETVAPVEQQEPDLFIDRSTVGSLLISFVLHGILLLILALIIIQPPHVGEYMSLLVETEQSKNFELETVTAAELPEMVDLNSDKRLLEMSEIVPAPRQTVGETLDQNIFNDEFAQLADLSVVPEINLKSHFGGRDSASREALLNLFGGNAASEKAVQEGLKWLIARQRADGSWSFDHRRPEDKHANHQAGTQRSGQTGATGLALMALLGTGQTHKAGQYKKEIEAGLAYLLRVGVKRPEGLDLRGRVGAEQEVPTGNWPMYCQGLATIALCEAYGLSRDRGLSRQAHDAIDFVEQARNRDVGGWRYDIEQAGDLSVTGWMIMALKSGKTSRLPVSDHVLESCSHFLDACQNSSGSQYSYVPSQKPKDSTTSIGLLCRMYQGWGLNHPGLRGGVRYLSDVGPSRENIYYNYYATQVLHHAGGKYWPKWNAVMRDWLVETQLTEGPEAGSWNVTDPHGKQGGRLYQTSLSIMTLEVYYRHLPLYQMKAVE